MKIYTIFILFTLSFTLVSACDCLIANCTQCNSDCTNCTQCNDTAPFLHVNLGELQGKVCTPNCTADMGYYVKDTSYCIINKQCPEEKPYAYRRSDGGENEVLCVTDCPISEGYVDDSMNCYSGILHNNSIKIR